MKTEKRDNHVTLSDSIYLEGANKRLDAGTVVRVLGEKDKTSKDTIFVEEEVRIPGTLNYFEQFDRLEVVEAGKKKKDADADDDEDEMEGDDEEEEGKDKDKEGKDKEKEANDKKEVFIRSGPSYDFVKDTIYAFYRTENDYTRALNSAADYLNMEVNEVRNVAELYDVDQDLMNEATGDMVNTGKNIDQQRKSYQNQSEPQGTEYNDPDDAQGDGPEGKEMPFGDNPGQTITASEDFTLPDGTEIKAGQKFRVVSGKKKQEGGNLRENPDIIRKMVNDDFNQAIEYYTQQGMDEIEAIDTALHQLASSLESFIGGMVEISWRN